MKAYTVELEAEVAKLKEVNEELQRKQVRYIVILREKLFNDLFAEVLTVCNHI